MRKVKSGKVAKRVMTDVGDTSNRVGTLAIRCDNGLESHLCLDIECADDGLVATEIGDDFRFAGHLWVAERAVHSVAPYRHGGTRLEFLAPISPRDPSLRNLDAILDHCARHEMPVLLQPADDAWGPIVGIPEVPTPGGAIVVQELDLEGRQDETVELDRGSIAQLGWAGPYLAALLELRRLTTVEPALSWWLKGRGRSLRIDGYKLRPPAEWHGSPFIVAALMGDDLLDDGHAILHDDAVAREDWAVRGTARTWRRRTLQPVPAPVPDDLESFDTALRQAATDRSVIGVRFRGSPAVLEGRVESLDGGVVVLRRITGQRVAQPTTRLAMVVVRTRRLLALAMLYPEK